MKYTGALPKVDETKRVSNFYNGHWHYHKQMGTGVGFIYIVRDHVLQRCYLGKKFFRVGGKLSNSPETNWKTYVSSSKLLKEMLDNRPREEFEFVCIAQYNSKGALSYAETWSLCHVEAPTTDVWYNQLIEKVSWRVREGVSEEHRARLSRALDWSYKYGTEV
jgi:hypothetical protein